MKIVLHLDAHHLIALCGRKTAQGISVLGHVKLPCHAFLGEVLNADALKKAAGDALKTLEDALSIEIHSVDLAITSPLIQTQNVHKTRPVTGAINQDDLDALTTALRQEVDADKTLLCLLPQRFLVDKTPCLDPLGMQADSLSFMAHQVTLPAYLAKPLRDVFFTLGTPIEHLLPDVLVMGKCAFDAEDTPQMHALVYLGENTTSISLYNDAMLVQSACLPSGIDTVTHAIEDALGCSQEQASIVRPQILRKLAGAQDDLAQVMIGDTRRITHTKRLKDITQDAYNDCFLPIIKHWANAEEEGLFSLEHGKVVLLGRHSDEFGHFLAQSLSQDILKPPQPPATFADESLLSDADAQIALGLLHYMAYSLPLETDAPWYRRLLVRFNALWKRLV